MIQEKLFEQVPTHVPASKAIAEPERKRLSGQNGKILERLKQGPATNDELARMARKYTSRISDLRAAGYTVVVSSRNRETGLNVYELKGETE